MMEKNIAYIHFLIFKYIKDNATIVSYSWEVNYVFETQKEGNHLISSNLFTFPLQPLLIDTVL